MSGRTASDLRQAVFGYNHSWPYVDTVLAWAQGYPRMAIALTVAPVSGDGGKVVLPPGTATAVAPPAARHHRATYPNGQAKPTPANQHDDT